ncbi:hypothetical protein HIM_05344 [Hirsutella minnesotensis 3608]|uniref:Prokaryotic-type class I peptide chain release factors domain-containing protein n=1 Tax=Hirsutella minnesotensis 3608 TaxID=1043627 RepID=A0A0F7ZPA3_9HYPO|nr:hypothetical protein HIM_05344 [Hirsutella minnesotensis 3608]
MLAAPWICRSCARALRRPASRPLARFITNDAASPSTLAPVLLLRAKSLTAEHDALKGQLDETFDASRAKRVGELSRVATALRAWEAARGSMDELAAMARDPAQDPELAAIARDELAGGTAVLKYELSDAAGDQSSAAGENPLKEVVLEVQDAGAYDAFRAEAGMHRVQRIPSTETKGRVHTSAVAVWVLPSASAAGGGGAGDGGSNVDVDDPESDFYVNPQDVRIETMRARGAGGQHVNKTESAIRMTHAPSGTVVSMQDHRSQQRNREEAWRVLRSRVAAQRAELRQQEAARLRSSVLSEAQITRGDKIRTYNYNQDRCTDHRAGFDVHSLPDVLQGGESLDRVMAAAREWLVAREVQGLIADEEAKARQNK